MAIRGAIDKMRENRGWHRKIPMDPCFRGQTLLFSKKPHWRHLWYIIKDNGKNFLKWMEHLHKHMIHMQQCLLCWAECSDCCVFACAQVFLLVNTWYGHTVVSCLVHLFPEVSYICLHLNVLILPFPSSRARGEVLYSSFLDRFRFISIFCTVLTIDTLFCQDCQFWECQYK